jgi:hypothetical protein
VDDLFSGLESLGAISSSSDEANSQLFTFTAVGLNRAEQMTGRFVRAGMRQCIFSAWANFWTRSLKTLSDNFLCVDGDVAAMRLFQSNSSHYIKLFDSCLIHESMDSTDWCYWPGIQYSKTQLDSCAIGLENLNIIVDVICSSPFLTFVLTPTAFLKLVKSLKLRVICDARRHSRLAVVLSWSSIERFLYNFTCGLVNQIPGDAARVAKEDCEASEKLLHAIVTMHQTTSLAACDTQSPRMDHSRSELEIDWCEALNVLGFSLTCLGCELPAIRKHEEALGVTERLQNALGKARSEALRGLAMLSMSLREGKGSRNASEEEGARPMMGALNTMDLSFGENHVLSAWLLTLCAFSLDQLSPGTAREYQPLTAVSVATRASNAVRKLPREHPLVAYALGSCAKLLARSGQYPEALELAEESLTSFRWLAQNHSLVVDNAAEYAKNMEKEVDNYRRKARRSTRMGHDSTVGQ